MAGRRIGDLRDNALIPIVWTDTDRYIGTAVGGPSVLEVEGYEPLAIVRVQYTVHAGTHEAADQPWLRLEPIGCPPFALQVAGDGVVAGLIEQREYDAEPVVFLTALGRMTLRKVTDADSEWLSSTRIPGLPDQDRLIQLIGEVEQADQDDDGFLPFDADTDEPVEFLAACVSGRTGRVFALGYWQADTPGFVDENRNVWWRSWAWVMTRSNRDDRCLRNAPPSGWLEPEQLDRTWFIHYVHHNHAQAFLDAFDTGQDIGDLAAVIAGHGADELDFRRDMFSQTAADQLVAYAELASPEVGDDIMSFLEGPAVLESGILLDLLLKLNAEGRFPDPPRPEPDSGVVVCGTYCLGEIFEPRHRRAHVDLVLASDARERLEAMHALIEAECPTLYPEWADGVDGWGPVGTTRQDVSKLRAYRDTGVRDDDAVRALIQQLAENHWAPRDTSEWLIAARKELREWLAAFPPCHECSRRAVLCRCYDLAWIAVPYGQRLWPLSLVLAVLDRDPDWRDADIPGHPEDDARQLELVRYLERSSNAAWARLLGMVGAASQPVEDPRALKLLEEALHTREAEAEVYAALAWHAERQGEWAEAARLQAEGARRARQPEFADKLRAGAQASAARAGTSVQ